ncbi:calcium-binding and spermatid-specific protein 1 [Rhynchonycteris naso]
MAEDGLPKIYSHPQTESSKITTEATIFFEANNTIPRSETTITSEGDHITAVSDDVLESDFSTTMENKFSFPKERLNSEDDVESHIMKSSIHLEKETNALSDATNSITENFIPVKISNISPPVTSVSLIEFPTNMAKEDILLDTNDPGDKDVSITSEVSGSLKINTTGVTDTPVIIAKKGEPDINNHSSSVKSDVTTNESVQITDSSIPKTEITLTTEKDFTTIPDITALPEEKITEVDLILPEDDPDSVSKQTDSDEEKLITVLELNTTVKREKNNPEDILIEDILLTDEESMNRVNVWTERDFSSEAENNPVLLTAVESRYDFIVPKLVDMNLVEDSAPTTKENLSENNRLESVTEATEVFSKTTPDLDNLSQKEDPSINEMGVFKLLKEEPDELLI